MWTMFFIWASNTHPIAYATDPIGTITTNIIGTQNMLEFACAHHAVRCAFVSSNEIYGENRGDVETFEEKYCGYIDCNTMRAGYPESKGISLSPVWNECSSIATRGNSHERNPNTA